jgi:hypothetical protein
LLSNAENMCCYGCGSEGPLVADFVEKLRKGRLLGE